MSADSPHPNEPVDEPADESADERDDGAADEPEPAPDGAHHAPPGGTAESHSAPSGDDAAAEPATGPDLTELWPPVDEEDATVLQGLPGVPAAADVPPPLDRHDDRPATLPAPPAPDRGDPAALGVDGDGGRLHRRARRAVLAGVLGLSLAAGFALGAAWRADDQRAVLDRAHARQTREREALAAARTLAVALTSYDYRHLDADFARVTEAATPAFQEQFGATSQRLAGDFTQHRSVASGVVQGAGLTSLEGDRAVVVLFVDQTVRNANTTTPRVDRSRLTMTLRRVDGRWLLADVRVL